MNLVLPLEDMTIEDKMQVMETIWDDLSHSSDDIESPSWHKQVLDEREKLVKNGDEVFQDWNVAKKNIQDAIARKCK